ncbi:hypothetical protein GCK72_009935 [Caenorhabditis remanei]|uniref:non-specific serine/threonine protein kinase n=1 Tax=Caenorhabditis remanei TaxID=31234 RepID=A0A6A5H3V7_CAERE|nr:hypothetical protein GCK72_009935 [Caenorhabditis remanei]KAF1761679.1 hypothetical protein GCK72_009935 [Caenorhabditis remanei]
MLGQIKATVNKKVNQVGSASSQTPPPPSTPKNHRRKKGRHGNRRGEKGEKGVEPNSDKPGNRLKKDGINKRKEKDTSSHTEDDGASSRRNKKKSMVGWIGGSVDKVVNLFDKEKRPPGQVIDNKPDPKYCAQKILQSERPDLFAGMNAVDLSAEEFQLLDEYMLRKGELRTDSMFTLGKVVDTDSKIKVGSGDEMEVLLLWSYGRFGAVYMTLKETDSEQERRGMSSCFALKTSRRINASTRISHEIKMLTSIYSNTRKTGYPTRITPMFFHGQTGGTPYLMMPMLDCSLERIRQEIGYKLPWSDAFYIGQEALVGIKECHIYSIIHRDIKPTNLLLGVQNNKIWWLCDFGDASRIGVAQYLSTPDSMTLPFLSRDGHRATAQLIPANTRMDIESWFYMILDLFVSLPWKLFTEEADTLAAKNTFWSSIDSFFTKNDEKLPDQLIVLAKIVSGNLNESTYSKISAVLKEGFHKHLEDSPWKPSWITKRKPRQMYPTKKNRKKEAQQTTNKSMKSRKKSRKRLL